MAGATLRVRMALGADRADDPTTWDMTDLTARTQTGGTITVARGRRSGNSQDAEPGSSTVPLDNGDGALTPLYPASTYYPDLDLGVPVEVAVEAGDPSLLTFDASGGAETADHATLDIVGDISVAVEVESPLRVNYGVALNLINKWRTTSDERSWILNVTISGLLGFFWTTDGTAGTTDSFLSTLAVPRYDSGPAVYGAYLDVNNGAAGKTIRFYAGRGTIADLIADPDAFLFDEQTESGTTSIYSSTAVVDIGINPETTGQPYTGRIRKGLVVEGSFAGTVRTSPDFTAQTPGATSFADAQGRTWNLGASADIDGWHTRLLGELAASGPAWPGHGVEEAAQVTWEVAGVLRRMRQRDEPLQSTLFRLITAPINSSFVKAYWPLEDGTSATAASSPIPGVPFMTIVGAGSDWRFAADSTLDASAALPHVTGTTHYSGAVPAYSATQSRVDIFFRIDTPDVTPTVTWIVGLLTSGTAAQWGININDTNVTISALNLAGTSVVSTTFASDDRFFGTWCVLSLTFEQNGGNVDWAVDLVPIPLGVVFGTSGSFAGTVGTISRVQNWGSSASADGGTSFGHIVVTSGVDTGWLAPADTAFSGEPAGSRFFRLCREQGITAVVDGHYGTDWDEALARGAKPMGPQRPLKLLDLLAQCAVVERAVIGEARELLGLTYRATLYNQDPADTFTNELGNPFAPARDDQGIVNDLTVTRRSAESYRIVDQDSIDKAGPFPHNQEANTETALQLPDLASWILHEALTDEMRIPSLQVELGKDPDLFDGWLSTCLGDLVQSDTVPPWYPGETVRQILAGYSEQISEPHWRVTINGTPPAVWDVAVRDDEELGIRDTGGSVLDADFDAGTDVAMDVETTLGPLWAVTAAANSALPFDLNVGGYRVTCTAIGAAAGQVQTFTVSATVWPDVPKTIPAGTAVRLWRPAVRGLLA